LLENHRFRMKTHTILLLEDTPEDQQVFCQYVSQLPFLTIAGVVDNTTAALALLQTRTVDLCVSDIGLPQQSGIELLRTLPNPPPVILTTVSITHSLEAYELGVIDYLVKSFSFERFEMAVSRALARRETAPTPLPLSIWLKEGRNRVQVMLAQIRYIEAEGPYCKLHLTNRVLLVNHLITHLLDQLPADKFVRVHRSYIVAVAYISRVQTLAVELDNQAKVPIGMRYRNVLRNVAK
jgi:DNA-binding LytR/AlgR family response regulator